MLIFTTIIAGIVVLLIGILILWSNPTRAVNRSAFTSSVHFALWLFSLYLIFRQGLLGIRINWAVAGSIPWHLWIVKESIAGTDGGKRSILLRNLPWLLISTVLTVLPFTEFFIPATSTDLNRQHGPGFYIEFYTMLALFGFIFVDTLRTLRRLVGVRKIELQVWLLGGCAAATFMLVIVALGASIPSIPRSAYTPIRPLIVLIYYMGTTIAITGHRVFDARQILLLCLEKLILISLVATGAYLVYWLVSDRLGIPAAGAFVLTVITGIALANLTNSRLNRWFKYYPAAGQARQAVYDVARRVLDVDRMTQEFVEVLRGWGQAESAVLFTGAGDSIEFGGVDVPDAPVILAQMRELRSVTPEQLSRERSTPDREILAKFLEAHKLGVLVLEEGTVLTVMIGVGIPATRRPFTYPQVTELMELASIIEGAYERVHYSMKAQHAEQLATVGMLGAGLAHEIRNPLVTIKTFVQLLPDHFAEKTFRDKFFRLINDEVSRIDRLTEQLLDLASPRSYHAEALALHPLLRNSLELIAAKAGDRHIRIVVDFGALPDIVLTDGAAARQVLLNLALNAVHAVETVSGERWIRVATRNVPGGIELSVSDNGPGIASEIMPRLFQPFQSTKSSGFGLGLAICSEILSGLNATIAADSPRQGQGATFRVVFPCPPPLS